MTAVTTRATCSRCQSTRLTQLAMTLTDGSPVEFTSCHSCEHKSWRQEGREIDRATVLAKATKPRPATA